MTVTCGYCGKHIDPHNPPLECAQYHAAPSPAPAEPTTLAMKMRAVDLAIAALEGEEIAWPDHKILHAAGSVARRYAQMLATPDSAAEREGSDASRV